MRRLWQTLILMQQYPVFEYLLVESLIKEYQNEYYSKLSESDKSGHSTPFIEFTLTLIEESLRQLLYSHNTSLTAKDRISLLRLKLPSGSSAEKIICRILKIFLRLPQAEI